MASGLTRDAMEAEEKRHYAAARIQGAARGRRQRRWWAKARPAAILVQAAVRGWLARKRLQQQRARALEAARQAVRGQLRLQRLLRHERELAELKQQPASKVAVWEVQRAESAATKIQAHWRGIHTKRRVAGALQARQQAAIVIQRLFRRKRRRRPLKGHGGTGDVAWEATTEEEGPAGKETYTTMDPERVKALEHAIEEQRCQKALALPSEAEEEKLRAECSRLLSARRQKQTQAELQLEKLQRLQQQAALAYSRLAHGTSLSSIPDDAVAADYLVQAGQRRRKARELYTAQLGIATQREHKWWKLLSTDTGMTPGKAC